jgi:membrane fusion protein
MRSPTARAVMDIATPSHDRPARSIIVDQPVSRPASLQLFRHEVAAARQTQWLGTVLLTPRMSHTVLTLLGVLAAAAIFALLFFMDFTRTARINGWLVPEEGLMPVYAPRPGVVTVLHVKEGAPIRKGEPLLTLSDELQSATLGATQAEIARRLDERRRSLIESQTQQEQLLAQQQRALAGRLQALGSELTQIEREIVLLQSRVKIAERTEALHRKMQEQGFISELRLQQVVAEKLEQRLRLGALKRNQTTIRRERLTVQGELRDLPLIIQKEIGTIQRSISQLEQELAEAEARREIVVPAPQDGTVTAIQAVLGGQANIAVPLLSIVPSNAQLQAHLYSPSRAVGFVRTGQSVLLRYQPYPYQRFGHYEGAVVNISRSAVSPAELPPQLASLTSLTGPQSGTAAEPIYRITVSLVSQSVTAYGKPVPLQPGMLLEADVALEKRRLYEWMLDPLYTLSGKWQ